MNLCLVKKYIKKKEFSFYSILTGSCLHDSFRHYWQYLNQLNGVITWKGLNLKSWVFLNIT